MTASLRNASLRQLAFLAGGLVALICVALLTLSSLREWGLRHETLKAAEVDLANVAQSLVQHADDSFELADSLLIGLVHRLEADGIGPGAVQRLRDDIDLRKGTMGRVRALFVYDAAGRWLATTEPVNPALFNNSDREYFRQHRASPDKGLLIGSPIKSRSGGQWVITASRRFDHPDGSLCGCRAGHDRCQLLRELLQALRPRLHGDDHAARQEWRHPRAKRRQ
jgi:hypothetical protein